MDERKCTVCKNVFDGKDASILTMSGFGNARYICPECSALLDTATTDKDYENITAAISEIGERANLDVADTAAVDAFTEILDSAKERAEKIKLDEYDFSLDGEDGALEEIPDDLKETEEDKALDEAEAKQIAVIDKITSWICGAMLVATVVYVIVKLIL